MITVKKVLERADKSVYQAYDRCVLGEVITSGNTIVSCQTAPLDNESVNRDFLLRSVVFLLSEDYDRVNIGYYDEYFKTLGFECTDGGMTQQSSKIVFPSTCCGHK